MIARAVRASWSPCACVHMHVSVEPAARRPVRAVRPTSLALLGRWFVCLLVFSSSRWFALRGCYAVRPSVRSYDRSLASRFWSAAAAAARRVHARTHARARAHAHEGAHRHTITRRTRCTRSACSRSRRSSRFTPRRTPRGLSAIALRHGHRNRCR